MSVSAPGPESRIYRPAELNQEVRLHLEAGFPRLWLEAELSNLARPQSGHLYFTLKDERAQIRCALFRGNALQLGFKPANGQKVLVRGRLSLYEARGDYQLIADAMLEAGAGSLQREFEALKRRLEAEGLFDSARKRALPAWPKRIALITSPSGAALRDLLKVLGQRWPAAQVLIYPSAVQGQQAPGELIRSLKAAQRHARADVIILARGGGSLEDLWAFNDEALARAIADCPIPLISGVGHETDFTIADFVADLRAPTPSAAAAAATPDGPLLRQRLRRLDQQISRAAFAQLDRLDQRTDHLERRLVGQHPRRRLADLEGRLVGLSRRMNVSLLRRLDDRSMRLDGLFQRLAARHPSRPLERAARSLDSLERRLQRAQKLALDQAGERFQGLLRQLNAISPLNVLERGYAVIRDPEGKPLIEQKDLHKGRLINILMNSFEVDAKVDSDPRKARLP